MKLLIVLKILALNIILSIYTHFDTFHLLVFWKNALKTSQKKPSDNYTWVIFQN
jgi:hypothetical protein